MESGPERESWKQPGWICGAEAPKRMGERRSALKNMMGCRGTAWRSAGTVRDAIEPCAKDKLAEIKTEMRTIYNIFEKFLDVAPNARKLPLKLDQISLSVEELAKLEEFFRPQGRHGHADI